MKKYKIILNLTILLLIFLACNKENNTNNKTKLALITDGSFNDKSFNESALNGALKLKKEFELELVTKEAKPGAYLSDIESLKDSEANFIWMLGYQFSNISLKTPLENPNIKYGIIDPVYSKKDKIPNNLTAITFRPEEGAFLAGYLASLVTKTNRIGFIGGTKGNIVDSFRYGYEAGVKYRNKDNFINSQYVGSFQDVSMGKTISNKMYSDNIDIIFHASGLSGLGIFEAAKELGKGYYIIGVDQDQSYFAPDNVIASVTKDTGHAIYLATSRYLKTNELKSGLLSYGLKEDVVNIIITSNIIESSLVDEINKLKKKIINKEIKIPKNDFEYKNFLEKYE